MREFTLIRTQIVDRPLEEVFEFFADARNLATITPPWIRFDIITPEPIEMRTGATIDYSIKLHGIPMKWRSEITAWEPPVRFVDEQRKGPYRSWVHEHRFEAIDSRTTRIYDEIRYSVAGGELVNKLFVEPDLERIFSYRSRKLAEIFDTRQAVNE
jgi:ligand-binding SRPBCC domain-containing protein